MKKLFFLPILIVIGVANAKAQSTPSSSPVQKSTEVKTTVQPLAVTAGNNLPSDQPNAPVAQKILKKNAAIKAPLINKEQSINALPTLINDKKRETKAKIPPMQNLDSGKL